MLNLLRVAHRLANAHVDDDLFDLRHFKSVLVAEFLHESRANSRMVMFFQTRFHLSFVSLSPD